MREKVCERELVCVCEREFVRESVYERERVREGANARIKLKQTEGDKDEEVTPENPMVLSA